MKHVVEEQLVAGGELDAQDAGASHFFLRSESERFVPFGLAVGDGIENGQHDGRLNGAGGANRAGEVPEGVAGVQVFGEERNRAGKAGDAFANGTRGGFARSSLSAICNGCAGRAAANSGTGKTALRMVKHKIVLALYNRK
jgi:hypothetical protein